MTPIKTITMTRSEWCTLYAYATKSQQDSPLVLGPTWSIDDSTLALLVPSADKYSCQVKSKGAVGTCLVTCSATGSVSLSFVTQIIITDDFADTLLVTNSIPIPQ